MDYAPLIRIVLRYVAGAVMGQQTGNALAGDQDLVHAGVILLTALVGLLNEWWYHRAKSTGGTT